MLASLTRAKAFWLVVVVMLGYGIITWDDNGPQDEGERRCGKPVNMIFEVAMLDPKINSIQVAIAATLGSGGHLAEPDVKLWDALRYAGRIYHHKFQACPGESVNAEVANKGKPVTMLSCWFWEQGVGADIDPKDELMPNYGDVTTHHLDAINGATLARCAAVVR